VGEREADGKGVIVGTGVIEGNVEGVAVGAGDGIQVPIVHVSLVGAKVGCKDGDAVGNKVGPTSSLQEP